MSGETPVARGRGLAGSTVAGLPEAAGTLIVVHHYAVEASLARTGCQWTACAEAEGTVYMTNSRRGAVHALARVLVAAGIEDSPLRVVTSGIRGDCRYRSFHRMAGFMIREDATHPVHLAPWEPYAGKAADRVAVSRPGSSQKHVVKPIPGTGHPPTVRAPRTRVPTVYWPRLSRG